MYKTVDGPQFRIVASIRRKVTPYQMDFKDLFYRLFWIGEWIVIAF